MKKINLELTVGFFLLAGFLCFVYLSLQLGEVSIFARERNYTLVADFENIFRVILISANGSVERGALPDVFRVDVGVVL